MSIDLSMEAVVWCVPCGHLHVKCLAESCVQTRLDQGPSLCEKAADMSLTWFPSALLMSDLHTD